MYYSIVDLAIPLYIDHFRTTQYFLKFLSSRIADAVALEFCTAPDVCRISLNIKGPVVGGVSHSERQFIRRTTWWNSIA